MAVFRIAFASETLFRTVNLNVIVPVETYGRTDVKKPEKFKTLYLLHGFGGSQDDWMDYSNLRAISEKYNLAIVLPSGENSFYENSGERFILAGEQELFHIGEDLYQKEEKGYIFVLDAEGNIVYHPKQQLM